MSRRNSITSMTPLIEPTVIEREATKNRTELFQNRTPPSFDAYPNKPVGYVKAVEKFFAGDAARIYQHLLQQQPEAQKALINHSDLLLKYLGIKIPEGFLKKRLPSSRTPTISYFAAPAAFALAAALLTKASRAEASLERLKDVLGNNPLSREPDTRDGREYRRSVKTAFVHLLTEFQKLPTDVARCTVTEIVGQHLDHMDPAAQEKIRSAAQLVLLDATLSDEVRKGLQGAIRAFSSLPTEIKLKILEKVQESAAAGARALWPNALPDDAARESARASARALARLPLVSTELQRLAQQFLYDHPDVAGVANADVFVRLFSQVRNDYASRTNPIESLRKKIAEQLARPGPIDIDLTLVLPQLRGAVKEQLFMQELTRDTTTRLRHVKLDCGRSRRDIEDLVSMSRNNPDLNIKLGDGGLDAESMMALIVALPLCKVTQLKLSLNRFTDADYATALAAVLPQSGVIDLHLYDLDPADLAAIAGALPESKVTHLNLDGSSIRTTFMDHAAVTPLAEALSQSSVIHLNLTGRFMDAGGASALAKGLPQSNVTHLNLNHNRAMGGAGVTSIAEALPHSKITTLKLSNTMMDLPAVTVLANALPQSKVTTLELAGNEFGDEGVKALAGALPLSNVTTLNLSANDIGPEGFAALGDGLALSKVTTLNLAYNRIDIESAKAIAELIKKSNLTTLDISNTQMDAEAAKIIAGALAQSKVTVLDVWRNSMGPEGVKAITDVLPQATV